MAKAIVLIFLHITGGATSSCNQHLSHRPHKRFNITCPARYSGNWQDGKVSQREEDFIKAVKQIANKYDVCFRYDLALAPTYAFDHVMPIFHVLPGSIVAGYKLRWCLHSAGFPMRYFVPATRDTVLSYISSGRNHMVLTAGYRTTAEAAAKWDVPFTDNFVVLRSGNDEDHFWDRSGKSPDCEKLRHSARFPSTMFTQYQSRHYDDIPHRFHSNFDVDRPTVLYIATRPYSCDDPGFISPPPHIGCSANMFPSRIVVNTLLHLARYNNVVIRPHPFDIETRWHNAVSFERDFPGCIMEDYRDGPGFVRNWSTISIVLAEPSAATSSAFYSMRTTPVVYLLRDWETYKCVRTFVLNESMITTFFPDKALHWQELLHAMHRAKRKRSASVLRARQEYFKSYFGRIDGYEEYRIVAQLLRQLASNQASGEMMADVTILEDILREFSRVQLGDGGVRLPSCNMECCRWTPR